MGQLGNYLFLHISGQDEQVIIYVEGPFTLIYFYRLQRTYNKKSCRWTVYPVKEKKSYDHVISLLRKVLEKRLEDKEGFHDRMEMEAGDPRDCQGLSLPSFHLQLLSLRKKESPDLQHRTINRLKHTIINHCTLFYLISYDYHSFIYQFNFWLSSKISKV